MSAEAALRKSLTEHTGLVLADAPSDVALSDLGIDGEDADAAFKDACAALGVKPHAIDWSRDARRTGPGSWTIFGLRHLAPVWARAEAARAEIERSRRVEPEPTIRSLAATIEARRHVASGPDLPATPIPAYSTARTVARGGSVAGLVVVGMPGLDLATCGGPCRYCYGTLSDAVVLALPTSLPMLLIACLAVVLPALHYLTRPESPVAVRA